MPVVLVALALFAMSRRGVSVVAVVIAVIAVGLLAVLLFDYPVATRFDREGVQRRMPLRRHLIRWADIRQFSRTRGRVFSPARFSSNPEMRANRGGLVAVVGRRRYLLVDQPEARDEFDRLTRLLDEVAPDLVDEDLLPPPDAVPTFLYRRRRWRPDGAQRR